MDAQTTRQLLDSIAKFPPMPTNAFEVSILNGSFGQQTFGSGTPFNDLSYTLFDTDYMEGETSGYDVFCSVDPSDEFPGSNTVKYILAVSNVATDAIYNCAKGDRIILGSADHAQPFFRRGNDGKDNDYAVIKHFDYNNGHIQLKGTPNDYRLLYATKADSAKTTGWYLFYVGNGNIDLTAFIFPCDSVDNAPANFATALCNPTKSLDLNNPKQFRFAQSLPSMPIFSNNFAQTGSRGKDIVNGIAVDKQGFAYLFGNTDGNLDRAATRPANEMFVSKINPQTGQTMWSTEIGERNGALLFDAVTDSQFIYATGRTFGALPGFQSKGVWDAIIVKMRLDNGQIVATQQWGESGIDGFGNITLDDAGNLYCSGAGSPPNAIVGGNMGTGDSAYVVAKFRASDLQKVWVAVDPVLPVNNLVAEAWGGISYIPSTQAGRGKLVVGGWFRPNTTPPTGADGFVKVYENLDQTRPTSSAVFSVSSSSFRADWVWDNTVDDEGNIYAVGGTTGNLQGTHRGDADAFIVKFGPNLTNPQFRQFGTTKADLFARIEFDTTTKTLFAIGYTYGNYTAGGYTGRNADTTGLTGDVIIQKFDKNLQPLAALQFGTAGEERGWGAIKGDVLYIGGMTEGAMSGTALGSFDGYGVGFKTRDLSAFRPTLTTKTKEIVTTTLSIYPNPSRDFVYSKIENGYQIFNAVGVLVQQSRETTDRVFVGDLPAGVYVLKSENGVGRFVKL
jgi:hypothetical protein